VTIPPNQAIPEKGDIVDVRYLYAYPGGSLYQPVYLGKRDDVGADQCGIGQLKYRAVGADEEG
jgi:bifunctional non-homologous end joining protein LigD